MIRYLFTNDLRISTLSSSIQNAATLILSDRVPSAAADKSANNNINTLAFYFNLRKDKRCTRVAAHGDTRAIVLNFIKKFQFPNPRTRESLENAINDNITFAPMRTIVKLLYIGFINDGSHAYITRTEIEEFLFFNSAVVTKKVPDLMTLYVQIKEFRRTGNKPETIVPVEQRDWKHSDRQIREMTKILEWAGCIAEDDEGRLYIKHEALTEKEKADLFTILTYNGYWDRETQDYTSYMDIDAAEIDPDMAEGTAEGVLASIEASRLEVGRNVLLYGVPGSGKSWTIEHEYVKPISKVERLVFHPDYTYSDFVGQILPCVAEDGQVSYEFTPGPFTNILRDAYLNPKVEYILVIEEINRGNAPAIFGEIFQLLDRKVEKASSNNDYPIGTSEYGITNANLAKIVYGDPTHKVRIPSNLSIIGTMNTSDQNVFTLDTAFQRRWQMRLIENNFENVDRRFAEYPILDTTVTWEKFCTEINKIIVGNGARTTSSEDKRLGAYFIHKSDLSFDGKMGDLRDGTYDSLRKKESMETITEEEKAQLATIRSAMMQNRRFPEKVIKYLWDDAFKFNQEAVFDKAQYQSLEDVIHAFLYSSGRDRMNIFSESVRGAIFNTEA